MSLAILRPFMAIFFQLHVYLSQNLSADNHFEVLNVSKAHSKAPIIRIYRTFGSFGSTYVYIFPSRKFDASPSTNPVFKN